MRKHCWVYYCKETKRFYKVQRPGRRSINGFYSLMWFYGGKTKYKLVNARKFRGKYQYVGKV